MARLQSAGVGHERRQEPAARCSEGGQIEGTPPAHPDAIRGGSTGRCVARVGRAGCHKANGKRGQHGSEHVDRAPPSLGGLGSRIRRVSEGRGQKHPYLAQQQPCPSRRSRLENAAAASRAARPRSLIGRGRPSQKPPRGAPPNELYGDPWRRTRTRAGLGAGPLTERSLPTLPRALPSPFPRG